MFATSLNEHVGYRALARERPARAGTEAGARNDRGPTGDCKLSPNRVKEATVKARERVPSFGFRAWRGQVEKARPAHATPESVPATQPKMVHRGMHPTLCDATYLARDCKLN